MQRICKRGHEVEVGKKCKKCKKISQREYQLNNPEKCKAINKKYQLNNPEKIKARTKEYYLNNSEKINARKKKWYEENLEKQKNTELVRTYGITLEMYNKMLVDQFFCCAICKRNMIKPLSVDHDHETGIVRGLLCNTCNSGLGMFKDNLDILIEAVKYLKRKY